MRILIVDDDADSRSLLNRFLTLLGHEVVSAENGEEAWALVQTLGIRFVISDWMMPVMNGFDVCKSVKNDPELAGTFIMMLTAKGQELDRITGAEVGADLYMTKPFDPDEILERAAGVLGVELG